MVKVNCAINELPNFKAYPGKSPGPQHPRSFVCPSLDYLDDAWQDCLKGKPSKNPYMIIGVQSAIDSTLAPQGKHVLSIFAQYAPYHLKSANWENEREKMGDSIVSTLGDYAPNVPSSIISRQVLAPPDLEQKFSLTDGNVFQIEIIPGQMFSFRPVPSFSDSRTPIRGLYLCGSGIHGCGGVSGIPGYNSSKIVLEDLKIAKFCLRNDNP